MALNRSSRTVVPCSCKPRPLQVTCFLAGLFGTKQAKSALVVVPKSVMRGWEEELGRWLVKAACRKTEVLCLFLGTGKVRCVFIFYHAVCYRSCVNRQT